MKIVGRLPSRQPYRKPEGESDLPERSAEFTRRMLKNLLTWDLGLLIQPASWIPNSEGERSTRLLVGYPNCRTRMDAHMHDSLTSKCNVGMSNGMNSQSCATFGCSQQAQARRCIHPQRNAVSAKSCLSLMAHERTEFLAMILSQNEMEPQNFR